MRILFLGKDDCLCNKAAEFINRHFDADIYFFKRGDELTEDALWWRGEYIISYLCPLVIPTYLLSRASKAAINFHPGPPEYPGIGCTNFAIYEGAKRYGITCHHMSKTVDSGQTITVSRFPVYKTDTVFSLTQRCYAYILQEFFKIMEIIASHGELPVSVESWTCKPYTRKNLDELCRITPDMDEGEIKKRIKATTYPDKPGAYTEIEGFRFNLKTGE